MSTKSSIFYSDDGKKYVHFYEDMMYPADYFLNKVETTEVTYKFNLEELCLIAKSINLKELERQSSITDEQINEFVERDLLECLSPKRTMLFHVFPSQIYGSDKDNPEDQILRGRKYYRDMRDRLRQLFEAVSSERVTKIYFGLEHIN